LAVPDTTVLQSLR